MRLRIAACTLLYVLIPGDALAGECPAPRSSAEIAASAEAAIDAFFVSSDQQVFRNSVESMRAGIPCLSDRISPQQVAQVHLVEGLDAFIRQQDDDVVRSLRAATNAWSGFDLTTTQAPLGSPLRLALDEARRPTAGPAGYMTLPACATLYVDAAPSTAWVADRPALLQVLEADRVVWSGLVPAGASAPMVQVDCPGSQPAASVVPRRAALGAGAAVSLASAGTFLVLANRAQDEFYATSDRIAENDPSIMNPTDQEAAYVSEVLPRRANTLSGAAIGAGVLALGLGTALVVTW